LIVIDIESGHARRRLAGRLGVRAEDRPIIVNGRELIRTGKDGSRIRMRVGADGVALDQAAEWLYFGPMTGDAIWRLRTGDLLDESLDDDALEQCMERYGGRPNTGGMWMSAAGDLYLTEVTGSAIGCLPVADRRYRRVLTCGDLFWPDGVMPGPDQALYVVVSQLPHAPPLNDGEDGREPPFVVVRFWPEDENGAGVRRPASAISGFSTVQRYS
jgi:sugar lactone lactonase YvrE